MKAEGIGAGLRFVSRVTVSNMHSFELWLLPLTLKQAPTPKRADCKTVLHKDLSINIFLSCRLQGALLWERVKQP